MSQLRYHYEDSAFAVLYRDNFIATITAGAIRVEHIQAVREAVALLHKNVGDKNLIGVHVINASPNRAVPADVRERLTLLAAEARGGSTALVIQGDSFAVTLVRSVMRAVLVVTRTNETTRIVGDIVPAMAWSEGLIRPVWMPGELHNASKEIQLAYDRRVA